ncbi:MAG: membrane protein insertase YidC [Methylovulum sp.]|jgi:YidC/Oxa1 family membrane protein insertase|nr:membrane protein insertase YidC [Methylovulum sp.]
MDNLRFILIVVFAMLLLLLTQAWEQDYGEKTQVATVKTTDGVDTAEVPASLSSTESSTVPATAGTQELQVAAIAPPVDNSKVVTITTDVIRLEIDTHGGTVRQLDLLTYPIERDNSFVNQLRQWVGLSVAEKNHAPVRLFNSELDKLFLAQNGLISGKGMVVGPTHESFFEAKQTSYQLEQGQDTLIVPLLWTDSNGLKVNKTFTFTRGSFAITVQQEIVNSTGKAWVGRQYSQLLRVPHAENNSSFLMGGMRAFDGGVIYTEKNKYQKISFSDMEDSNLDEASPAGWAAMIQHYFASAWIPPADQENHYYTKKLPDGRYVIGSYSSEVVVDNASSVQLVTKLFAGPKIQPVMESIATGLELTVDYSVLTFIGKPIYWLLNQIHNLFGNWGLAIIGVTLCIKLLFFPLSQASFKSMAKMRNIQPLLKDLQERYKDDRMRFNNEMMALYKREKVNPLGGCLPVLVQIPVFMCLYWVLSETVEFRQAPFLLWIQDLSVEDPFYILPLIMGVTMKIQQSLNPAPIDPIQAKVMKMFPLVFTVFFLFFPAGLVLYWVINNTLSILQQWYITKTITKASGLGHTVN